MAVFLRSQNLRQPSASRLTMISLNPIGGRSGPFAISHMLSLLTTFVMFSDFRCSLDDSSDNAPISSSRIDRGHSLLSHRVGRLSRRDAACADYSAALAPSCGFWIEEQDRGGAGGCSRRTRGRKPTRGLFGGITTAGEGIRDWNPADATEPCAGSWRARLCGTPSRHCGCRKMFATDG